MDEEEELKELEILPSDNLIVTCRTEEELSTLEVYVYNDKENNLYVHHDIMLPSFPLAVEWMDYKTDGQANRVAVGTFEPEIEIWDLDIVDAAFPTLILGSKLDGNGKIIKSKGKKKSKSTTVLPDRHISAVTCLSWNKHHRNLLLSGSADKSIKLWDLETGKAVQSYEHHTDKVVALAWHPTETTVFLSGGYDQGGRVCVLDSRAPGQVQSWLLGSDVECLAWDPFHPERFFVSTENGLVRCYDARNYSQDPLFTIHAHDAAVSALAINPFVEGLLITGSGDKTVKIWDIRNGQCKCLASKELEVGKVFTAEFCVDSPFVLAVSGSKGKLTLWNLNDNGSVQRHFGIGKETSDRPEILAMPSDSEESDQEEEEEEMEDSEKMEESEEEMEE
jgi:periodic tryptophan protein 1